MVDESFGALGYEGWERLGEVEGVGKGNRVGHCADDGMEGVEEGKWRLTER